MNANKFTKKKITEIREVVGKDHIISALSGGVDSSVCTVLGHKAIGDRMKVIFIDDGLMREGEPQQVQQIFADLNIKVEIVDAKEEFFDALRGKIDPEDKRKAFRNAFYTVFKREVLNSEAKFLLQGTIAPDIIETEGGVKTQHNILEQIGIDPKKGYGYKVIEPLKELFKPGVREAASAVGLPEHVSQRMPFPGPGLATRIVGEVTPERVELVRKATVIVEEAIVPLNPFQAFAVLLSDKGTGVLEGRRKFGEIVIIRSVESRDAMTAEPTRVPWEILLKLAKQITTEIPQIGRVAYDLTSKPPATIEYI